jgi:hypothetical protein
MPPASVFQLPIPANRRAGGPRKYANRFDQPEIKLQKISLKSVCSYDFRPRRMQSAEWITSDRYRLKAELQLFL